jgi:hypothetical protein
MVALTGNLTQAVTAGPLFLVLLAALALSTGRPESAR